jgi:hypothetical protein
MASDREILAHLNRTRREAVHGETGPDKMPTQFKPFKSLAEAQPGYEPPEVDINIIDLKKK